MLTELTSLSGWMQPPIFVEANGRGYGFLSYLVGIKHYCGDYYLTSCLLNRGWDKSFLLLILHAYYVIIDCNWITTYCFVVRLLSFSGGIWSGVLDSKFLNICLSKSGPCLLLIVTIICLWRTRISRNWYTLLLLFFNILGSIETRN